MFIRIGEIELKPPLLRRFVEPDGGLHVSCEALEGVDESEAKKLLGMEGCTQSVKWEDKNGVEHQRIMQLLVPKTHSRKSPDGKKITHYDFTLVEV